MTKGMRQESCPCEDTLGSDPSATVYYDFTISSLDADVVLVEGLEELYHT